jgi:hypothetical protein
VLAFGKARQHCCSKECSEIYIFCHVQVLLYGDNNLKKKGFLFDLSRRYGLYLIMHDKIKIFA